VTFDRRRRCEPDCSEGIRVSPHADSTAIDTGRRVLAAAPSGRQDVIEDRSCHQDSRTDLARAMIG
jgi:hypothetical protein